MGEDEKKDTLFRVKDIRSFKEYVRRQVWKKFCGKIHDCFDDEDDDSILNKQELTEEELPQDILDCEIEKFVVQDEFDRNKGYILKADIARLITSLTNELISNHLNSMVDIGVMEMCWDDKKCEFIWRPKLKE